MLIIALLFTPEASDTECKVDMSYSISQQGTWVEITDSTRAPYKTDCWVKVEIECASSGNYALQGGNWYMRNMSFYDDNRNLLGKGNNVHLNLIQPNSTIFIYYPFTDEKSTSFEIALHSEKDFLEDRSLKNYFQIPFLAIYALLAFASMSFFIGSRDRVYLHFFFYLLSAAYFFAYQYGLLGAIWPVIDQISPTWLWISSASLSLSYAYFAQSFLYLRERDLFCFRLFSFGQLYIAFVVLLEIVSYLAGYDLQHNFYYKIVSIGIQLPLMSWIFYRVYQLKNRLSNIFLIGAGVLILSTLSGQILSTMKLTFETNYFIQAGLILDILIFSVGMSVRIGLVYKGREKAQSRLIGQLKVNEQLQDEYTAQLEVKVSERTAEIQMKSQENELLLKEVHHRVKNNLQMISSLLSMQARRTLRSKESEILLFTQNRVRSIALIHEHLYQHDDFSQIPLEGYVSDLITMLLKSLFSERTISLKEEIQTMKVDFDTALHVGLILNELVTNSIKYAFPTCKKPELLVQVFENNGSLNLVVQDNGKSPESFDHGFGWNLITSILEGVHGSYSYEFKNGCHIVISIRDYVIRSVPYDENRATSGF
ncbi:MAG: histidine kinase dimerization/phosphoacceptor domain -containing protein [Cyclobacteriaceae bacterium]